ncbi:hypothetical protein J4E82_008353 [Alternaria postmessia]|uniref:uncharacterized protein n=1 Tax=Alternaria postmessia TaxID=1187938 RepID=UPI002224B193|nr:uncharacterized protein J4E82_008353 [Alternaria postmessia]KAI5372950.1 hypothetical protein J4E82_008353 [Alternaria postmessia]
MASASLDTSPFSSTSYKPKYDTWPYNDSDFVRYDENDDGVFYRQPRLVTHIDDPSIARLTQYYDTVLPKTGRIMDMCTSWKSFYPSSVKEAIQKKDLEVYGVGLNAEEMALNGVFMGPDRWRVMDLNKPPHDVRAAWEGGQDMQFDAVTCVVSIDYLNKPLEVCRKLLEATHEGGTVHLVISNRCFPNKVVRRWMMLDERSRLEFVGDYLHFEGWKDVEIVDLCAKDESGMRITDDQGTVLLRSPYLPDHLDPLWVVRARKETSGTAK